MSNRVRRYRLVWLRSDSLQVISKKEYDSWQQVMADYGKDYLTSMDMTIDEMLEYVCEVYSLEADEVRRIDDKLKAFMDSDELVIMAPWLT